MVRWTARAVDDLIALGDYIGADDPTAARSWVEGLRARAAKASLHPRAGRVVPELARADVREVLVRNYRIVYRIGESGIVVLTVFEGHRLLGEVASDEG